MLTLESGETVTISTTSPSFDGLSGNGDGIISGLNDLGQVAFSAFTSSGNGIFVATVRAIPEPATACVAIWSGLILLTVRPSRSSY